MTEDEKFMQIIKRHKPRGWRLSFSGRRNKLVTDYYNGKKIESKWLNFAEVSDTKRVFRIPHVIDAITLHIALHEFAHVHLKHFTSGESTMHREEFEAEHWAMNIMKIEGIPVPRRVRDEVRSYIKDCIEEDRAKGIDIEPHILRFVEGKKKREED